MATVRARYRRSERAASLRQTSSSDPSFILFRVLGNDLEPRQRFGQTLTNLDFTIANEPTFPGFEKRFIVNRIFDSEYEAATVDRLADAGLNFVRIPFSGEEYRRHGCDSEPFGDPDFFRSEAFLQLRPLHQVQACILACAPRIRYAMNINGARNVALDEGRTRADWVLPFDGSCFVSERCFAALKRSCVDLPEIPYRVVPMVRMASGEDIPIDASARGLSEEPQIGFHRSTSIRFSETYPYGLRDKAELIMRLGIPGFWDRWRSPDWLPRQQHDQTDRYLFETVERPVYRLPSGMPELDDGANGQPARYARRNIAILATIRHLDRLYGCNNSVLDAIDLPKLARV